MDKRKKRKNIIYIVAFLILCLIPLLLMPWFGHQKIDVGGKDASLPAKFSHTWLRDMGDYFSKTFAFRGQLIDIGTYIRQGNFRSDTESEAILGKEGYLYYRATLDDYTASHTMSDGELANLVYNLKTLQDDLEDRDIDFVFTIAPNKNSLYSQFMPDKYHLDVEERNSERLRPLLEDAGVNYVNMFTLFRSQDEVLYHKLDSHWTNKGAALAMDALLDELDKKHTDYSEEPFEIRKDFTGDLYRMGHPTSFEKDENVYYDKEFTFRYTEGDGDVTASSIRTENDGKKGKLLMFRDSFGNALTPFMAEEYGETHISKALPYDAFLAIDDDVDAVVCETVERHLGDLAEKAPVISLKPEKKPHLPKEEIENYHGTVKTENSVLTNFSLKIYGTLDPNMSEAGADAWVILRSGDEEIVVKAFRGGEGELTGVKSVPGYAAFVEPFDLTSGEYEVSVASEKDGTVYRSAVLSTITIE